MDQVRTIDAGAPPARFARGWHCLGLAGRFRDGVPHAVAAFGTKLVIFADSAGQLHVLDAYCRHMGGDLSQGTVKGDAIACPFHDWRWGGDGRCAAVPYARRTRWRPGGAPRVADLRTSIGLDNLWARLHGIRSASAAVGRHRPAAARPVRRAGQPGRRQVRRLRRAGLHPRRGDLAAQEPDRQPAALRRGRPRLPAAPLVRAVLLRLARHRAGGRAARGEIATLTRGYYRWPVEDAERPRPAASRRAGHVG